ncbi:MAG: glycosyltransferase [Candidatus Planktophila sp.]|jgi:glycosyltransferase involved in cell wall biosynthesis|nr:glycosyltransferase [Candidatus Planktophila sp.]MBP7903101.1 glycosyltransferase [Candidatus Planktophila sp.]
MESAGKIKVLQIIARMNVGGPAVIVADLMRGLDSSRFEQKLITGYCADNEADYLETVATDVKATRIGGLGRSISPMADARAFLKLIALIRRENPDVIHTHTAKAGVLGRLAAILAGSKALKVHTFHGHLLHGYFAGWKIKLVIAIEKFLATRTDILIAVGNQVRDDLLKVGIGKSEQYKVFYPGLPAPADIDRDVARKNIGLDLNAIYCTFVGRLTQIKRPDRLLDVVAACQARGLDLHFLVAGEGELFESSKARALEEKLPVTFLGWRSDIDQLFAASDIAILTSDNEGIPLTLIQAAFAGIPIVAPRVGSIADIVIDGETGFLTSTQAGAMASALSALVTDEDLREELGSVGRVHAEKYFSLEKSLADHAALYEISQSR